MNAAPNYRRTHMLRTLHARLREQGIDEETYRARMARETGKRSAKLLSEAELQRVLDSFHVKQTHPHHAKIKALFIAAYNLGAFASGTDKALNAFIKRQTGKEQLGWVAPAEANAVTEALKAICARHGFVPAADGIEARRQLLRAQWKKLSDLGKTMVANENGLDGYLSYKVVPHRGCHRGFKRHELDHAARLLGTWLREVLIKRRDDGYEVEGLE